MVSFQGMHHHPRGGHFESVDTELLDLWWERIRDDVGRGSTVRGAIEKVQEVNTSSPTATCDQP